MVKSTARWWILLALLVLLLPLKWVLAWLTAAAFHELCHIAAIILVGGKVLEIRTDAGGTVIRTAPMSAAQELVCTLAGPAGSLLLVALGSVAPLICILAGMQGLYNLLPLYPLDGGRALRCLLCLLLPEDRAWKWFVRTQRAAASGILLAGVLLCCSYRPGPAPLIWTGILLHRTVFRKYCLQSGGSQGTIELPNLMR